MEGWELIYTPYVNVAILRSILNALSSLSWEDWVIEVSTLSKWVGF